MRIRCETDRLAYRLKIAIRSTGLSRAEFARRSGVDRETIRAVMRRSRNPGTTRMESIQGILRTAAEIREEEYRREMSEQ